MSEDFRSFYVKSFHPVWPATSGEPLSDVIRRLANATADWCDLQAARVDAALKDQK